MEVNFRKKRISDYLRVMGITETCNFKKFRADCGKCRCVVWRTHWKNAAHPQGLILPAFGLSPFCTHGPFGSFWGKEKQHVAGATPRRKERPATSTKPFSFFRVVIIFLIICCLSASARSSACCCLGPGRAKLKLGTMF